MNNRLLEFSTGKGKLYLNKLLVLLPEELFIMLQEEGFVTAGDRFGLIRYGSRVDVFFPQNTIINVKLKDKVIGGETILGEFK